MNIDTNTMSPCNPVANPPPLQSDNNIIVMIDNIILNHMDDKIEVLEMLTDMVIQYPHIITVTLLHDNLFWAYTKLLASPRDEKSN
jgi:hypothetical protein